MNREDLVLERLRAADPAPNDARIHPDELSPIFSLLEERRGAVTTHTPVRPQAPEKERRLWLRPALGFSIALLVVVIGVGIGVFLFGGDGPEDVITPPETTIPTQTTAPAPTTTPTTEADPTAIAESTPFETLIDRPMRNMEAILPSDGNPVFVGEVGTDTEPLGTIRLVRCTDPDCVDEPDVADIVTGIEWQGNLALAMGPDGNPLIGYRSGYDPEATSFNAYMAEEQQGRPIHTLLYCRDDLCRNSDSYEFGHHSAFEALAVGGMTFSKDGLPVFTYVRGPPNETELHLVACEDWGCQSASDVAIDTAPFLRGSRFIHGAPTVVDETGGVLVAYTASTPTGPPGAEGGWDEAPMRSEVRVAHCAEPKCTDGALVTVLGDGHRQGPIVPREGATLIRFVLSDSTDPFFAEPYVIRSVTCGDAACSSFTSFDSGPIFGAPPAWDWSFDRVGRLVWAAVDGIEVPGMVEDEDGMVPGEVIVGHRLAYHECTDVACSSITTIELGEITDADYWAELSVLLTKAREPLVILNEQAGIRILRPMAK